MNAEKVAVTGKKEEDKKYYRHSGHIGHLKTESLGVVRGKTPKRILQDAVGGMLPKTRLRAGQMKRLLLVIGSENPHAAQQAKPLEL